MDFKIKIGDLCLYHDTEWKITLGCNVCGVEEDKLENFLLHSLGHSLSVSRDEVLRLIQKLNVEVAEVVEETTDASATDPLSGSLNDINADDCVAVLENNSQDDPFANLESDDKAEVDEEAEETKDNEPLFVKTRNGIECKLCKKSYRNKAIFKNHLSTHDVNKRVACSICGATYSCSSNLRIHQLNHFNIRPYACDQCDKKFITPGAMKLHQRSHTDERPYSCEECGKSFKLRKSYQHHCLAHTNERSFICEKCGKAFLKLNALREHEHTHSDVRAFKCDICGASFKKKKELRVHDELHQEKKYKCEVCGTKFAQYPGLYSHMKTHNNKHANEKK